jgi:hypothetical protein
LKRVFGIEIEQCARCGGRLEVIASIEEPELIERILAHRREKEGEEGLTVSLGARAPPQGRYSDSGRSSTGLRLLERERGRCGLRCRHRPGSAAPTRRHSLGKWVARPIPRCLRRRL